MGLGSVRGLSQFTANEIAEMGFDIIWAAFKGTNSGALQTERNRRPSKGIIPQSI
jgi:hypothetical protein